MGVMPAAEQSEAARIRFEQEFVKNRVEHLIHLELAQHRVENLAPDTNAVMRRLTREEFETAVVVAARIDQEANRRAARNGRPWQL